MTTISTPNDDRELNINERAPSVNKVEITDAALDNVSGGGKATTTNTNTNTTTKSDYPGKWIDIHS